jgi:hypothetical protein
MVADGVRAQVVTRANILPAHLTTSAHEGRQASCQCWPLMEQLMARQVWRVAPAGTREACTQDEHDLRPLRACVWPEAPQALAAQAWHGIVEILLTMCAYCGAVEVRDTSYHQLAGVRSGSLATRRRSDILGWYAGKRPAGRVYT